MPLLIVKHHTLADWDFEGGALYRSLSPTYFISAPTSLKLQKPAAPTFKETVLCRIPETLVLPQGELRSWYRFPVVGARFFNWRNQAALGSANVDNCYLIYLAPTYVRLWLFIGGNGYDRGSTAVTSAPNTWEHWRLFWYNGLTPGEQPAMCVDFYKEIAGEWVKQGTTIYDTLNKYADSEINRCGLCTELPAGWAYYHDDTEIWGPV